MEKFSFSFLDYILGCVAGGIIAVLLWVVFDIMHSLRRIADQQIEIHIVESDERKEQRDA